MYFENDLIKAYNINHLIFQTFDKEFSRITSLEYIRDILAQKIGLKDLVIGYNHHFGRNREGNFKDLLSLSKLYSYDIEKIDPQKYNGIAVSSSKIRNLISKGDIDKATNYLGRYFSMKGVVIKGKSIGVDLGYPTANLMIENKFKLLPADGVYAVLVNYKNKQYLGMMNIGFNPTFQSDERKIEVHILDFNKDIYGELLEISFIKKIRNEKKFNSIEDLKSTLKIDENKVRLLKIF